jgi:hypothetical protein
MVISTAQVAAIPLSSTAIMSINCTMATYIIRREPLAPRLWSEHIVEVSPQNPDRCTPNHRSEGHEPAHIHGPDCGHEAVPHGDHVDYLVNDHLHHPHGDHCDDHGSVEVINEG